MLGKRSGMMPADRTKLSALARQAEVMHASGQLDEAMQLYGRVLAAVPNELTAAYNVATILMQLGREKAAIDQFLTLTKYHPNHAISYYQLGHLFYSSRQIKKAVYNLKRALSILPNQMDAYLLLIRIFGEEGRFAEACDIAALGEQIFPAGPEIPTQLGVAAIQCKMPEVAEQKLLLAVDRDADAIVALYNLARLADDHGDQSTALQRYRAINATHPDYRPAAFNLAELELRTGARRAATNRLDELLIQDPLDAALLSSRLMAAQYEPSITSAALLKIHKWWDRSAISVKCPSPVMHKQMVPGNRGQRLKLGLVSPDLGEHPVGYFLVGALENMPRDQAEINVFADLDRRDDVATRIRKASSRWTDTAGWSDERLATEIANRRVDILFDLSGHTLGNRLAVFVRRPAPVQITWAGYVGTTGLSAMDYLLADQYHIPYGEDQYYVEKVMRLPDGYICFDPPALAPEVGPLPAGSDGPLTFASFHNPAKLNCDVIDLWSQILSEERQSRIIFTYSGFALEEVQARVSQRFKSNGIDPSRLIFEGKVPRLALLSKYGLVDIALDTFPYSGGLTTCEALWMGIPVVTLSGNSFAGRHSTSHLSNVGLPHLIAKSADEYISIVKRLGSDRPGLAALRAGLRDKMRKSPLCDSTRFANNLITTLRQIWDNRLNSGRPV